MLSKSRLSQLRRYGQKKYRETDGKFFVEGWRALLSARQAKVPIDLLLVTADAAAGHAGEFDELRLSSAETVEIPAHQMAQLTDSVTSPGIAALVSWRSSEWDVLWARLAGRPAVRIAVLDQLQEPGNAGSVIRTCDWFGLDAIVLGRGSVEAANPKVVRATMGSLFNLPVVENADLTAVLPQLKASGIAVWGAVLEGSQTLGSLPWPARAALVIGNEARGLGPATLALLDQRVRIAGYGGAESLNAAVAAGILLADWRRER